MIRINLLSVREVEREAGRRQEGRLMVLGTVLVLAILLVIEAGSRMRLAPIRAEHEKLRSEMTALDAQTKEITELTHRRSDIEEKLKTIASLVQRKVGPVQILADLSDATPDQVWLLEFTENGGAATITGLALDNQTIAAFMRRLGGSPYFTDVDLVEATQSEQDGVSLKRFVVNARLSFSGKPLLPAAPNLKFPEPSKRPPTQQRKGSRA